MATKYPPFLGSEHAPVAKEEAFFHVIPVETESSIGTGMT